IMSPEKGAKASGPTKVVAAVAVPEGKVLQKLEFYSNEARVATLYQAPYEQVVNIRSAGSLGYVRIVGTLDDGTLAEDLRYVNAPYLLAKLTNRTDKLFRSFAGMRAEGSTALYDAIVYGLYQFAGVKGKKALVILTDGKDTASKFDFETTVDYARRAGISIYGIGLRIPGAELDVKYKLNKLAQVTGGQTFYIDSAKNLEAVYKQIN